MNLLALDTSTECASIALLYEGRTLELEYHARSQHAEWVLPSIQNLLSEANITLKQLDGIVFGQGPGSFTGLRIACSIVKGLASAADLPLYPVSTLKTIAEELSFQKPEYANHAICSVIDASMNQLYWAMYKEGVNLLNEERVSSTSDMPIGSLAVDTPLIVAGVGFMAYKEGLERAAAERPIVDFVEIYPKASAMLRLAVNTCLTAVSAEEALPVYIRDQVTQ
jgi:tRNA threonylcarbamoyladenosine biosynthesis protein TsaB